MKLTISQMLLEKAHFEHKGDFLSKPPNVAPPQSQVDLQIELVKQEEVSQTGPSTLLVRLRVASNPEEGYGFEVIYSALLGVSLEGETRPDDLDRRLMISSASMLFPFVREVVANLTMRGRFGASWVAPTDFSKIIPATTPLEPVTSP